MLACVALRASPKGVQKAKNPALVKGATHAKANNKEPVAGRHNANNLKLELYRPHAITPTKACPALKPEVAVLRSARRRLLEKGFLSLTHQSPTLLCSAIKRAYEGMLRHGLRARRRLANKPAKAGGRLDGHAALALWCASKRACFGIERREFTLCFGQPRSGASRGRARAGAVSPLRALCITLPHP